MDPFLVVPLSHSMPTVSIAEGRRLDAEIRLHRIDIDRFNVKIDTLAVAFGRNQYEDLTVNGSDFGTDFHKVTVGLRASFGSKTLLEEDRPGATMDT